MSVWRSERDGVREGGEERLLGESDAGAAAEPAQEVFGLQLRARHQQPLHLVHLPLLRLHRDGVGDQADDCDGQHERARHLDLARVVLPIDRAAGFVMGASALALAAALAAGPRTRGWTLWASWAAAVAALQLAYWSVLARFVLFLLPPLALWAAERLERQWDSARAEGLWKAGAALSFALTWICAVPDWRHAGASRDLARELASAARPAGRVLWCAGHWGLQESVAAAGGRMLDAGRGGWEEVRRGDLVVVPGVNTNVLRPGRPLRANETIYEIGCLIPVRLISAWTGEGAFYSSAMGFLPWSISNEPVERFTISEPL